MQINNDLNTSLMLTLVYEVLKDKNLNDKTKKEIIKSFDKVLGLDLLKKEEIKLEIDEKYILDKIEERKKAKENKDYLLADKIREELLNKNIRLIDTKDNTTYEIINLQKGKFMIYYIILAVISTVSIATYLYIEKISKSFRNTYLTKRLSGFDVVKYILDKNDIDNIYIVEKKSTVTNEYDVEHNVVRLDSKTFNGESIFYAVKAAFISGYVLEKR